MSWPVSCLGDVSEFIRNGASIPQAKDAGGLPITRIESISERVFNQNRCGYAGVGAGEYLEYRLKIGDILVSHINSEKHLAKCAIFEDAGFDVIHGMNLLCARPDQQKIFPRFFFHYLSSPKFLNLIPAITKKSVNQASFTVTAFKELPIPLPPLPEQKRIAAILDKADAIRRKRHQAIQLADDFLRAVFLDMFGDPVTNPKGWEVSSLDQHLEFLTSGSRGWAKYYSNSGSKFIRIQNVGKNKLLLTDMAYVNAPKGAEAARTKIQTGDVLLSITADLGRSSVVTSDIEDGYVNQHLAILRLKKDELNSRYLSAYLSSDAGVRQFFVKNKSAVKAGINFSDIRSLEIQVPPISLQRSYENLYERVMGFQLKQSENLDVAEAAFSSLSQKAFSGQL